MTARVNGFLSEHALASGLTEQFAAEHHGKRVVVTLRRDPDFPDLRGPIYEVAQTVTVIADPTAPPKVSTWGHITIESARSRFVALSNRARRTAE